MCLLRCIGTEQYRNLLYDYLLAFIYDHYIFTIIDHKIVPILVSCRSKTVVSVIEKAIMFAVSSRLALYGWPATSVHCCFQQWTDCNRFETVVSLFHRSFLCAF